MAPCAHSLHIRVCDRKAVGGFTIAALQPLGQTAACIAAGLRSKGDCSQQVIYASLAEKFPGDEEAWDLHARRHLGPHAPAPAAAAASDPGAAAAGVYEAALAAVPTARMHDMYAAFLAERLDELAPEVSAADGHPPQRLHGPARRAAAALLRLYEQAAAAGAASEALLLAWPQLALRCGKPAAALAAAAAAAAAAPRSAAVWRQLLLLRAQQAVVQARARAAQNKRATVVVLILSAL